MASRERVPSFSGKGKRCAVTSAGECWGLEHFNEVLISEGISCLGGNWPEPIACLFASGLPEPFEEVENLMTARAYCRPHAFES